MCCLGFSLCGVRGGFSLSFSRLARGGCPAGFRLGTGRAGLQASAREAEKGGHRRPSRLQTRGGEGWGEKGGRQGSRGWGGGGVRRRIALQCALNKGGHLDLIGSNALFSDPICLSPAKFGGQRRPIVGPSFCKSIPVRVLIIADVSGGIRAVGGPPTMKRRGPAAGKANKTAAPHPPRKRKQA